MSGRTFGQGIMLESEAGRPAGELGSRLTTRFIKGSLDTIQMIKVSYIDVKRALLPDLNVQYIRLSTYM